MRTIDYDNLESLLVRYQETHEQKLTRTEVKLIETVLFEMAEMSNNGWVSVKDRMPDKLDQYLVVNDGKIGVATYHDGLWIATTRYARITHWIPFPELPKEKGEEQ